MSKGDVKYMLLLDEKQECADQKRQHSTLGHMSPIQFLDHWLVAQQKEKLVA